MSKRAVVILFEGMEPRENMVDNIIATINPCILNGTQASVKVLDENDIVCGIIGQVLLEELDKSPIVLPIDQKHATDEVKKAIMYINNRFGDTMVGKDRSEIRFSISLASALASARFNNNDVELSHAMDVLVSNEKIIAGLSQQWRNRYGFTEAMYDIVRKAYMPLHFG